MALGDYFHLMPTLGASLPTVVPMPSSVKASYRMLWGFLPSMMWTLVTPSSMAWTQQSTLGIMPPAMVPCSFSLGTSAMFR